MRAAEPLAFPKGGFLGAALEEDPVAVGALAGLVFHEGVATRGAAEVLVRERGMVKFDSF